MLSHETITHDTFNIEELRAISVQNRGNRLSDPAGMEHAISSVVKEYEADERHKEYERMLTDLYAVVFPYLYLAAEMGATAFPLLPKVEQFLQPNRGVARVFGRTDLYPMLFPTWDYYGSKGLSNLLVQEETGVTWYLTW